MLFVDIYLLGDAIDWFVCTPLHISCTFPIQNVVSQLRLSPHCDLGQVSSGVMGKVYSLRLERGVGQQIFQSCVCFLIIPPFLNIYRHAIHQIKADYHSYLLVLMILYVSSDVKLKTMKET